jgi:hypothetical protein
LLRDRYLDRLPKVCAFIPNSEVAGGFLGILTTDDTDFHGYKDTPNRFENVSITRSSSVPFRAIRDSISLFGFRPFAKNAFVFENGNFNHGGHGVHRVKMR